MKKRILIGADIVPTAKNFEYFKSGDANALLGEELKAVFDRADYRIFNLETPLTDRCEPILKTGPNLSAPSACIAGYKAMGIDLLTVANNHTMDYSYDGLFDTLNAARKRGLPIAGAGKDLAEA